MKPFKITDLYTLKGYNGLWKFRRALQGRTNLFEHLITGKKVPIHNIKRITHLKDVGVYMSDSNDPKPISEVIEYMQSLKDGEVPDDMSNVGVIDEFMERMVPGYDPEQFKSHHMEKLLGWFHTIAEALKLVEEKEEVNENS